jgi:hypothetical protein
VERFLAANGQPIRDADPETDVPMVEKIADTGALGRFPESAYTLHLLTIKQ